MVINGELVILELPIMQLAFLKEKTYPINTN